MFKFRKKNNHKSFHDKVNRKRLRQLVNNYRNHEKKINKTNNYHYYSYCYNNTRLFAHECFWSSVSLSSHNRTTSALRQNSQLSANAAIILIFGAKNK